jgi:hypothetical protein
MEIGNARLCVSVVMLFLALCQRNRGSWRANDLNATDRA